MKYCGVRTFLSCNSSKRCGGNDFDPDYVEMDGTRINRFIFEVITKHQRCE